MSVIEIKSISFGYRKKVIYDEFTLTFEKGKVYSLVGHNGAGKTTLIRLIVGLLHPSTGEIVLNDVDLSYLPDAGGLFESLSVKQNIEIFYELQYGEKITKSIIKENLVNWDLIDEENSLVKELSMGQKRRLSLIVCTFSNFDVLLLDEPTNGIDIASQNTLSKYIKEQKEKGKTIIISSHDLKLVEEISDCLIIINNGKIVYQGDTKDVEDVSSLYVSCTEIRRDENE